MLSSSTPLLAATAPEPGAGPSPGKLVCPILLSTLGGPVLRKTEDPGPVVVVATAVPAVVSASTFFPMKDFHSLVPGGAPPPAPDGSDRRGGAASGSFGSRGGIAADACPADAPPPTGETVLSNVMSDNSSCSLLAFLSSWTSRLDLGFVFDSTRFIHALALEDTDVTLICTLSSADSSVLTEISSPWRVDDAPVLVRKMSCRFPPDDAAVVSSADGDGEGMEALLRKTAPALLSFGVFVGKLPLDELAGVPELSSGAAFGSETWSGARLVISLSCARTAP
mmetsp:Transcript_17392/g.50584  ORF Transcript_17392/g.50584 Transcript_17392/m.50584 type:complete len:281 (-) Transcript_17392:8104-8946(-)